MTKRKIEYWVIPPEQDAEFVACMEEVLETYATAYNPDHPVLCMDEQPVQLLKETRVPIAATKKHGQRVDYEYERNGMASIFMFAEPLSGFRVATARERRTKTDWAIEVAQLLDTRYADCQEVTLVCDNLNTHTKGAFYEAFEPERARGYLKRIKFCYTPKHGSWLNVAECELSCLTSQCLSDRRIGELTTLQAEITAWSDSKSIGSLAPSAALSWRSFWTFCALPPMTEKRKRWLRFLRSAWKPLEGRDRWRAVKGQRAMKNSGTSELQVRRKVTAPGNVGAGNYH